MQSTYLEAIRQGISEEMERDPNVFLIGEDIGVYGGAFKVTQGLLDRFGEKRVVDTPISESAIVGAAIGASFMGLRPVAEMQFSDFISCGFDQIVNFAAKCRYRWNAPVPIVVRCAIGRRHSRRSVSLPESRSVVRAHAWAEGYRTGDGV
jgi:2-oxoisovalerate dehydrogenase E1 component beta subunit